MQGPTHLPYNLAMPISTTHTPRAQQKCAAWLLPAIVLAAFAIRMVVVCFTYRGLPDADKFYEQFGWEMGWIARALASGHGYSSPYFPWSGPTALQPPLYPALLSVIFRLFGIYTLTSGFVILTLNSLFSALTCIPIYFSAKYSLSARGAKIAAWIWAFYPFAIYFSAGRVWEYSLTCLLFTTCFCIAQRIHTSAKPLAWLGWGALFGLTALSNPAVLSTLPFLFLLALYRVRRCGRTLDAERRAYLRCRARRPHPVDCAQLPRSGHPLPGSRQFLAGDLYRQLRRCLPWIAPRRQALTIGPIQPAVRRRCKSSSPWANRPGWRKSTPWPSTTFTIIRDFLSWLIRRCDAFSITGPDSGASPRKSYKRSTILAGKLFYVSCVTLLMLRGIRRFWRFNRAALLPYLVLICFFPITYYITHPLMDYRQPIEPAIIVLAVAGAVPWKRIKPGQANARSSLWIGAERAS